jgi:hypothetical protein
MYDPQYYISPSPTFSFGHETCRQTDRQTDIPTPHCALEAPQHLMHAPTQLHCYSPDAVPAPGDSARGQTARFVYVTTLRLEGKHRKAKALPTQEVRHRTTNYFLWEIMFRRHRMHPSLSAAPPTTLIRLTFIFIGRETHRFVPCTAGGI